MDSQVMMNDDATLAAMGGATNADWVCADMEVMVTEACDDVQMRNAVGLVAMFPGVFAIEQISCLCAGW